MTPLGGLTFLLPFLRAEHTRCLTAAILDFPKGAFFEANRGKNHTLYLYLPELLICVKRITEVVFYFVFSFTVKEGSKKGLKKERGPIVNRQLLYQLSLLPHFLPHGVTIKERLLCLQRYEVSELQRRERCGICGCDPTTWAIKTYSSLNVVPSISYSHAE